MLEIINLFEKHIESISNYLTIELITLISILISFLIYSLNKRNEIHMKKHEIRKLEYTKFFEFFEKVFKNISNGKSIDSKQVSNKLNDQFFELGATLLANASRKVYRKYVFYREFQNNPIASRYRDRLKEKGKPDTLILYLFGDMLTQIRREVSLDSFKQVSANEALAFFVNDLGNNPAAKIGFERNRYIIRMIKFEMFLFDRLHFLLLKKAFYMIIAPFFTVIKLLFKYLLGIPLGQILGKLFPKFKIRIEREQKNHDA